MSAIHRRGLRVDDPLAGGEVSRDEQGASSFVGNIGGGRLKDIPLARIHPNPAQPRKRFDESALASLSDSIRERGVLQPVIVRPAGDEYELVAGERRWRAAELAGEETIPALVDSALDEAGSLELALIENVVRENLTAIEQARTLAVLINDLRMTGAVLAKRLGRSRADIANTVRLLDLPDEAVELIDSGGLTKGHGKALLAEPDHHRRRVLARRAADGGWSVRALEAEIARAAKPTEPRPSPHPDLRAAAAKLQDAIVHATGCEARATPHRHGFQIILDQAAADRLARILDGDMTAL
ncbi:MAG TPA: ParB/RepB/Spo0J family partition protein [Solirubrobacteraceae bacterium]|jgi:ParB family chromosome partitioning protein|nr:ParB/RepB/Spo0J family partition protein [Solirubrobacteraceae bacterium]